MLKMWMLNVDVDHQELRAILGLGHFQYLHGLVPQGTNKDIHGHRLKFTIDDVHESNDYLVP